MAQSIAAPVQSTITQPSCPPWCIEHFDDVDAIEVPPSRARYHYGPVHIVTVATEPMVVLHLEVCRTDYNDLTGRPGVAVTFGEGRGEAIPAPVTVDGCRSLAESLWELADVIDPQPVIPAQRTIRDNLIEALEAFVASGEVTL